MLGLLIAVVSLVVEHQLSGRQASVVVAQAEVAPWRAGIEPVFLHWQVESYLIVSPGSPSCSPLNTL